MKNVFERRVEMELYIAIAFVTGLIIGLIFSRKSAGVLKIDHSNPGKDVYRFEIDDLDSLSNKKKIVIRVDNNADLSQK